MSCIALVGQFYLFVDQIKEIGDGGILGGGLEGGVIGGFAGGLRSGNEDVPIWRGLNGVGPLALPAVPGVLQGPFPVINVFSLSIGLCLAIQRLRAFSFALGVLLSALHRSSSFLLRVCVEGGVGLCLVSSLEVVAVAGSC
jgi:hypothetical protein